MKWKAPTLGTVKRYEVRFYRLFVNASGETVRSIEFEATLVTPHTQILVPPGVLLSGKTYYMRVLADTFANHNQMLTRPFSSRDLPIGEARFASGIITVQ